MRESGPVHVVRRMLWNRADDEPSRPQPQVVLLGPVGSGKTHAVQSVSNDLGWGVVHATYDFDHDEKNSTPSTVEVITKLVYRLSIKWRHRATPRFKHFAIALIAIQTPLDGLDRPAARKKLYEKIKEFDKPQAREVENRVNDLIAIAEAADLVTASFAAVLRHTFPLLIENVRLRLRRTLRSLADFPQAVGDEPLDALVSLNELARDKRPRAQQSVTTWLVQAFLADVRENHKRMSGPDLKSPCACTNPERKRHRHNWVLLLDNIDRPGGNSFLADLANARNEYVKGHPDDQLGHDALLVVATSGRWLGWHGWLPPWQPGSGTKSGSRAVPSCRDATYDNWANPPTDCFPSPVYPVMLDPLRVEDIAEILDTEKSDPKAAFVRRASAGLPMAVLDITKLMPAEGLQLDARDVLEIDENPARSGKVRYPRLTKLRLTKHLHDVDVDDFVTAAPFATAPWLIPVNESDPGPKGQPHLGQILSELRTALWVTARDADGDVVDHPTLHPWIATNLVLALALRHSGPTYDERFAALRDDSHTTQAPVRRAYCQLALGDIASVVTWFAEEFQRVPHQDWLDRLDLVVRAPNKRGLDPDYETLYRGLVDADVKHTPAENGRTEIRSNIARLVAAGWLTANPFMVRNEDQNTVIFRSLQALAGVSERADVSPLVAAANRVLGGLPY